VDTTTEKYSSTPAARGRQHRTFTPCPLALDQLDGIACLDCGSAHGTMRPVGSLDGCQVFAHDCCDEKCKPTNR
jgi:hypothetical protein